jgi:hypothetical protein
MTNGLEQKWWQERLIFKISSHVIPEGLLDNSSTMVQDRTYWNGASKLISEVPALRGQQRKMNRWKETLQSHACDITTHVIQKKPSDHMTFKQRLVFIPRSQSISSISPMSSETQCPIGNGTPPHEIGPVHDSGPSVFTNTSSTNTTNHSTTSAPPPSAQLTEANRIPSPMDSPLIWPCAVVVVGHICGYVGTVRVLRYPVTPTGELCLTECHQDIIMSKSRSAATWHLESVELQDTCVEYMATNRKTWVIRNLRVPKMWTVEGLRDQKDEEDEM